MRKAIQMTLIVLCLVGILLCFGTIGALALAEEEVPSSEQPASEDAITQEEATAIVTKTIEDVLGKYLENSLVVKIITWLVDAGVLAALVGIYIRYRRVKNKTIEDVLKEARDKLKEAASSEFAKEMDPKIAEVVATVADLTNKLNATLQALALSQDKSAEGKIAMLNLISKAADADEETQEILDDIKENVIVEAAAVEEITDKVSDEYQEVAIF